MTAKCGYYDEDGEWISEPYVGFGSTLTEVTEPTEDQEDDWSLTSVRLHLLDLVVPLLASVLPTKDIIETVKMFEEYVYSE